MGVLYGLPFVNNYCYNNELEEKKNMFKEFQHLRYGAKFYFEGKEYTKESFAHKKDSNGWVTFIMCNEIVFVSDRNIKGQAGPRRFKKTFTYAGC